MKEFLLAPFIAIKTAWQQDVFGKWLITLVLPVVFFAICIFSQIAYYGIKQFVFHGTISSGVVVEKWFEPAHDRFVGKHYVHIPERLHVVIRGENWLGYENQRDVIVSPESWKKMEIGTSWKID